MPASSSKSLDVDSGGLQYQHSATWKINPTTRKPTGADDNRSIIKDGGSFSLGVTIAIGCALLFVNVLILAGICFQRDKMKQERKRREQEEADRDEEDEEAEREIQMIDSESAMNLKGSIGHDTETNSSSNTTLGPSYKGASHTLQYSNINQSISSPFSKQPISTLSPNSNFYTAPRRQNGRTLVRQPDSIPLTNCVDVIGVKRSSSVDNSAPVVANHHHHNPSTLV